MKILPEKNGAESRKKVFSTVAICWLSCYNSIMGRIFADCLRTLINAIEYYTIKLILRRKK